MYLDVWLIVLLVCLPSCVAHTMGYLSVRVTVKEWSALCRSALEGTQPLERPAILLALKEVPVPEPSDTTASGTSAGRPAERGRRSRMSAGLARRRGGRGAGPLL
jgi:hypothetical protein